jgi:hypothetical protein
MLYLGKIETRKCQYKYQHNKTIDFVGNYANSAFNPNVLNYLGEWNKETLYKNLTNYANLVLLSNGEADPLVVKEALMCGLGVVISERAAANLNTELPFIDIVRNEDLDNIEKIDSIIENNRIKSIGLRYSIRKYAMDNFDWNKIIDSYLTNIGHIQNLSSVTVVSCYYKVPSKHPHEQYNLWINNLLKSIEGNMIIYTSTDLVNYLEKICLKNKSLNVKIKVIELEELEIKRKYPDIWDIQYSLDPQNKIRTKECYIIWNSKLHFIKDAIQINPFNSNKFIWMDIGCVRDDISRYLLKNFPIYGNISCQKVDISLINPFSNKDLQKIYFFNEIHLSGAIFGGTKQNLLLLHDLFYSIFDNYIKENKFVGCDQQILSSCYVYNKELFNLLTNKNSNFNDWFYLLYEYSK